MHKELIIDGKKLRYRVEGKGRPVILVHGFGEDGSVWNNQIAFLQDRYLLIIPELPGSGGSEIVDKMTMDGLADVLKILLNEIQEKELEGNNTSPVTMIGHSMGGYITLAFAEKYPELLNGFGLFHSSAYPDNEEKKATRQKGIAFIQENGAFEFLKTSTPNLFSEMTKTEQPALVSKQIAGLSNFSAPALVLYYEAMMERPDRTAVLENAKVPVLFIVGKYDTAVPPKDSLEQSHLPEKSYIHVLDSSGHLGMLEEPQKANEHLAGYLDEI
jgi:pimeloyl-ACP methyl ester carboxylesterase